MAVVLRAQHQYLAVIEARCFENKQFVKDKIHGRF